MNGSTKWLSAVASGLSAAVALFCPVCIPAIGSLLASLGLGFVVTTTVLRPALIALLAVSLGSLAWDVTRHRRWEVIVFGVVGAALVYAGRYLWPSTILLWAGAVIMIGTSVNNLRLKRHCPQCRTSEGGEYHGKTAR